jgi:hypothetical protein
MHSQSQTFCEENSTKNNQNSAAEKAGLYKARLYVWRCSFASQPLLERLTLCEKRWEQLSWFSTTRCFNEKMARLCMVVVLALSKAVKTLERSIKRWGRKNPKMDNKLAERTRLNLLLTGPQRPPVRPWQC